MDDQTPKPFEKQPTPEKTLEPGQDMLVGCVGFTTKLTTTN